MQPKLDSRLACPTEAGDAESSLPHAPRNTAHRIGRIPRREPLPMTDDTPCGQYEKAPGLSSFSLGSGCISWMSPDSEPRIPFVCFRDVCGNDGKVFPPGSADHVDLSAAFARSQYQAAMAARANAWPGRQEAPAPPWWRRTCRRVGLALSPPRPARGRVGHARPLRE